MQKYVGFIIFIICSLFYLLSCEKSTSSINPENSKAEDLVEQRWILYSFRLDDGSKANLRQDEIYEIFFTGDSSINGKADCNSYRCSYSAKDGGEISIGPSILSTKVGCKEGTNIDEYYRALQNTKIYEVNSLFLKLGNGSKGILHFIKQ